VNKFENELYDLPRGWIWTQIKEIGANEAYAIVDGPFGSHLKISDYVKNGKIPVMSITNIDEGFQESKLRYITEEKFNSIKRSAVKPGDIIVAKIGSSYGKSGYYPEWMPVGIIPANMLKITVNKLVNRHYVFFYLKSTLLRTFLDRITKSTAQPAFNVSSFRDLPFPLPPAMQQQRVSTKIEELFACLDAGVEGLRKVKAQLNRYRQAVLKYAFEGKLTEEWRKTHRDQIEPATKLLERTRQQRGVDKERNTYSMEENLPKLPEEWTRTTIGELAEINPRLTNENLPADSEVSFLPMKAVEEKTGRFDSSIVRKYEEVKRGYTSFEDGDVLFAKITPCMENGKIAVVEKLRNGIGFGSTEFHVIRPRANETPKKLFFYYLLMDGFREDAQRNMTGSAGQLRVSARYLRNATIPLCSFEEQQRIVEEVEFRFSITQEVAEIIDTTLLHSEQMRQSILKTAFEGKLVPQDPNDEPAGKLLEHIKAERTKSKGEKDTKRGIKNKPKQLELSSYVK